MSKLLSRWATPLISALFAISLVSGVSIFFGLGRAYFNEMHEWLSLLLIVPFALHLWRNWRPFLNYVRNRTMISASAATLVAAVACGFVSASHFSKCYRELYARSPQQERLDRKQLLAA